MAIRFYLGSQDNQVEFVLTNSLYPMPIDLNHANSCKEGCPLLALTCPWGWSLNLFVDELHDNWNPWGAPQEFHLQLRCQCFGRLSFEWHLLPGFPRPCRDARCHQQDCFLFFECMRLALAWPKMRHNIQACHCCSDILPMSPTTMPTSAPWTRPLPGRDRKRRKTTLTWKGVMTLMRMNMAWKRRSPRMMIPRKLKLSKFVTFDMPLRTSLEVRKLCCLSSHLPSWYQIYYLWGQWYFQLFSMSNLVPSVEERICDEGTESACSKPHVDLWPWSSDLIMGLVRSTQKQAQHKIMKLLNQWMGFQSDHAPKFIQYFLQA